MELGITMKKTESGSSLVVALVMLTIITLVAVYSIEGSALQSKMVASSLFSTLTYQECRNEQEANIRHYNDNGGKQRAGMLALIQIGEGTSVAGTTVVAEAGGVNTVIDSLTSDGAYGSKSQITHSWTYIREAPDARGGFNIDTDATTKPYLFENECQSGFRFANNSQTLGAIAEGLVQADRAN
jgi:Tfp pilus assembly protein PilX